jgi:molecular chaperone DnaK
MSIALGIDLGTTNTVMAVVQGSVKQLQNRQNENLTRSAVGFHNGQFIVGSNAMDRMAQDPTNLILSVKRLMGRSFLDEEIQKIKEKYLYKIQAPENGTTEDIRVVLAGKEYSPIEISAKILKKIKDDAEYRLNDKVEFATITVPAYFGDKQVEATRLAGLLAGFKVQMILDEPTAAAIAFSVDQVKEDEARNILIYDLGGGTFDVSVLTVAGGVCARLNTEGNMWLGGDDFDHKIMDFILEKIKKDSGIDGTKDKLFMLELKKKAENAKIQLSGMSEVNIYVPSSLKDSKGNFVLVDYDINTAQFERMIEPQVTESIRIVKKAMERAGLTDDQIDNVLLVGGSSTIPLVQRALEDTFGAQKILKNVDAMLCVAYGAAIIANRFGENVKCLECETMNDGNNMNCTTCGKSLCIERQNIIETTLGTNKPYGIQTVGDKFVEIIPKNTPYPMQEHMVKMFEVPSPNLRRLRVPVYAGENEIATQNDYQFTVWLPLPQGTSEGTKLEVGFLVDGNGTFSSVNSN